MPVQIWLDLLFALWQLKLHSRQVFLLPNFHSVVLSLVWGDGWRSTVRCQCMLGALPQIFLPLPLQGSRKRIADTDPMHNRLSLMKLQNYALVLTCQRKLHQQTGRSGQLHRNNSLWLVLECVSQQWWYFYLGCYYLYIKIKLNNASGMQYLENNVKELT